MMRSHDIPYMDLAAPDCKYTQKNLRCDLTLGGWIDTEHFSQTISECIFETMQKGLELFSTRINPLPE